MSASFTIVFVGIRRTVLPAEVESFEDRSHPVMASARKAGLDCFWGNFGKPSERYLAFIGRLIGRFGAEDHVVAELTQAQFAEIHADVHHRLQMAGLTEPPALFIQFVADE